ncbi:MAG: MptD family putative ECF transporter S component [Bifidobacteriaceae bacterium]|jgi:energy-coupling factor transport system substrate-specific component|nr:MptD family putative ECF transporter S component [Bifidobacteriaceae bacterium]
MGQNAEAASPPSPASSPSSLPANPADQAGGAAPPGRAARLSARDLLSVAIFAVIFLVAVWAIAMLGVISPLVWLLATPLQIIVGAIPFMLFLTRVQRLGVVSLFGVVIALFYLLAGNSPLSSALIALLGVAADVVCRAGSYRSKWSSIWAYTVFSLGFFTPFLPLFADREAYFATTTWESMGADYIEQANQLLTLPVLGGLAAVVAAAGFAGALIGSATLRKHFARAGLA